MVARPVRQKSRRASRGLSVSSIDSSIVVNELDLVDEAPGQIFESRAVARIQQIYGDGLLLGPRKTGQKRQKHFIRNLFRRIGWVVVQQFPEPSAVLHPNAILHELSIEEHGSLDHISAR